MLTSGGSEGRATFGHSMRIASFFTSLILATPESGFLVRTSSPIDSWQWTCPWNRNIPALAQLLLLTWVLRSVVALYSPLALYIVYPEITWAARDRLGQWALKRRGDRSKSSDVAPSMPSHESDSFPAPLLPLETPSFPSRSSSVGYFRGVPSVRASLDSVNERETLPRIIWLPTFGLIPFLRARFLRRRFPEVVLVSCLACHSTRNCGLALLLFSSLVGAYSIALPRSSIRVSVCSWKAFT